MKVFYYYHRLHGQPLSQNAYALCSGVAAGASALAASTAAATTSVSVLVEPFSAWFNNAANTRFAGDCNNPITDRKSTRLNSSHT